MSIRYFGKIEGGLKASPGYGASAYAETTSGCVFIALITPFLEC